MPDTLIKMKTGTITKLEQKDGSGNPVVPIEQGTVYFAVDATNEYGKIVFDNASNQRIVMSTRAETADHALTADNAGSADAVAWGNIVGKPNSFTPSAHTHGNIANGGTISSTGVALANGDFLLFSDASNSGKIERTSITFDGSTATKALTQKGTWETFNNYSHPTGDGNLHIPATGTSNNGKVLMAGSTAGSASWQSLPVGSTSLVGMVQLSSTSSTTEETLAATPKGVWAAINTLDVITEDNTNTNKVWATDDQGVPGWTEISSGGAAPIFEDVTLAVANWDTTNNTYTIQSVNATADSIQIVSLPDYTLASSDEIDALGAAKIVDGGQDDGYFILKALGDLPTIPIDIRVCYQYSSDDNLTQMQSAAASANAAAVSAAQAAASAKVQRKTVTFSSVTADTSVSPYNYKYEVAWTGVTSNDWVDASGITDQDWAIESATNKVILRFTNNISTSKTVICYWATTETA